MQRHTKCFLRPQGKLSQHGKLVLSPLPTGSGWSTGCSTGFWGWMWAQEEQRRVSASNIKSPAGEGGVVTGASSCLVLQLPLCFTGRRSVFPTWQCLARGRRSTLVGCLQGNPLLYSSLLLRQENPNTTFLPPRQPGWSSDMIIVNEM